jgi:hypothetical protein
MNPGQVGPQLNQAQRKVLDALLDGAESVAEVASDTDLSEVEAEGSLETLTTLGYADCHPRPIYCASGVEPPAEAEVEQQGQGHVEASAR